MAGARANIIKNATGLTGLLIANHPHHTLSALYGKTLRALNKMPPTAAYRIHTEKIVSDRAHIVANNSNVADIEKQINCGQIEEVIVQAENELLLARKMLAWQPWEPLVREAPAYQWEWPPAKIKKPAV